MNDIISVDEYRKQVGLPPRGQPEPLPRMHLAVEPQVKVQAIGKAHHALGRLKTGEMNNTEARFEREELAPAKMRGEILWYAFEAIKLRIAPRTFLTVDFFVLYSNDVLECIDVKGAKAIVEEDAKVKMKVAAAAFPFRFKFAYPRPRRMGGGWLIQEVAK